MYKLFTDKTELFECNIKLEGASLKNSQARLLIESPELSLVFRGEIDSNGKCQIPIKKLKGLLDESIKGNIKLEVIAEDTYFVPWESNFMVETAKKVTVEVKSSTNQTIISESKPKVSVINIKENTVPAKNIKENLVFTKKDHIVNLLRLLVKENINLKNLSVKKPQLNSIIGNYVTKHNIKPNEKNSIIEGLLQGLSKIN